jgi:hypothetical protein
MFFSLLGGLQEFGVLGIVLGPVFFAIAVAIVDDLSPRNSHVRRCQYTDQLCRPRRRRRNVRRNDRSPRHQRRRASPAGTAGLLVVGGAALLDIGASGRRGVELPKMKSTCWPHAVNFERLRRSRLDWGLLCPEPMVDEPAIGLNRLRISIDTLPV